MKLPTFGITLDSLDLLLFEPDRFRVAGPAFGSASDRGVMVVESSLGGLEGFEEENLRWRSVDGVTLTEC